MDVLMRTLQSGTKKLLIYINKSTKEEHITLDNLGAFNTAKQLYADPGCRMTGNKLVR